MSSAEQSTATVQATIGRAFTAIVTLAADHPAITGQAKSVDMVDAAIELLYQQILAHSRAGISSITPLLKESDDVHIRDVRVSMKRIRARLETVLGTSPGDAVATTVLNEIVRDVHPVATYDVLCS